MGYPVRAVLAAVLAAAFIGATSAPADVVTAGHDNARTAWYPDQPRLTPQTVGGGTFGQLFASTVTGQVYAQPLVSDNVLLVATEDDWTYGLDPETGAVQWSRQVGTAFNASDVGCADLAPHVGITGTPVIDSTGTGTAYYAAKSYVSGTSGPARYDLHAVDLATGAERPGFPVRIQGAAQNNAAYSFDATDEIQRPGLLLMDGVVYVAFAGHCDRQPYQGWVFGIRTGASPGVAARWVSVPGTGTSNGAGIWQSGGGLVSDSSGRIFFATGNGWSLNQTAPVAGTAGTTRLGESEVRLRVQADGSLATGDFFQPYNSSELDGWDADISSGAPVALPSPFGDGTTTPHLLLQVGKQGRIYLLNRDALGGYKNGVGAGDAAVAAINGNEGVWARPAVWPGDGGYVWFPTASGGASGGGSSGHLVVYKNTLVGGQPSLAKVSTSPEVWPFSSSGPTITSDGTTSGSGIAWLVKSGGGTGTGSQLIAYAATPKADGTLTKLFASATFTSSKFNPPGVGSNGRIYVGTRDGRLIGFGAPITVPLSSTGATFPAQTVGSTSSARTVTITASSPVTITALAPSTSEFALGNPSPALPATLAAGQSLTVPATFTPSAAGQRAASLTVTTSAGQVQFPLTGTGQLADAHLSIGRNLVDFGGLPVGGSGSDSVTLTNDGGSALTFASATAPSAPFSATGLPAAGSTLAAGASLTIALTFSPTSTGTFADTIAIDAGAAGSGDVGLSGSASTEGHLTISRLAIPYGNVKLGATVAQSFTVTNDGGSDITITKSKPPVTGPFLAVSSLDEGTVLAAGATRTLTVNYTASSLGGVEDGWVINSTDSSGVRTVDLTGAGAITDPTAGGWTLNGAATVSAASVTLTPATAKLAGSAIFPGAFPSSTFSATFTSTIGGGNGADGTTIFFENAGAATDHAIGGYGGLLGFGGIPGIAVALDTYKGAGDPSNNFVGITDGKDAATGGLHWLATSTAVPALRSGSHVVRVDSSGGTLTVSIDGVQILQTAVALPASIRAGLSAGTGGAFDQHVVSGFSLTGPAATTPPVTPPPTAADAFSRTVVGGWGAADTGGAYTLSGAASAFSVDGSVGNERATTAGQNREADLGISVRDVDVTVRLRIDKVPVGGDLYAYVPIRKTADGSNQARLRFTVDGHVYATFLRVVNGSEQTVGPEVLVPGVVPTAGAWVRLHLQAVGSSSTALRLRVWPDGSAEPTAWTVAQTESTAPRQVAGTVGLRGYVGSKATNAPVTFSWDDLVVTAL